MNVYSLSRARQQVFAVALLVAAVALAALVIFAPLSEMAESKREDIRRGEAELAKWRGIAASGEVMAAASSDPAANVRVGTLALPPSTDAQAAASVQAIIRRILGDAGADLKSIQPLDSRASGNLREAGVRVVALATQQQLDDALFAIDHSNPRLFVREANFQLASGGSARVGDRPQAAVLQVRLDVYAYALPEE